ncbi:carbohydrate ABC transporter permease [Mucisphaera calidilacus]|uniref:L-arabinose transport system permease protein AraP n=1 Tax=Mucisphaera calidilacus TaxID=2527982 RepID=A0A518BWS0_9BACT|nr:sugar ABC transporter permease [Mucisphaera calidilacus]QDU71419.1 L-arabinose transport system permease protein AraP [Mucisphaera calidilacus]
MSRKVKDFAAGVAFLAPNIAGVLVFTVFPVVVSLVMAFSNWDLTLHNAYKTDAELEFVGLNNVYEMFQVGDRFAWDSKFIIFFGNTLFFMMGIPFCVLASLFAAIMLSKDTRAGGGRLGLYLLAGCGLTVGCVMLAAAGAGASAMMLTLLGVAGVILLGGAGLGSTFYRTLFYTPSFVAGVATFLVWKKLYSRETGPVNQALNPVLDGVADTVNALPAGLIESLLYAGYVLFVVVLAWGLRQLRRAYLDGDLGWRAAVLPVVLLFVPLLVASRWSYTSGTWWVLGVLSLGVVLYEAYRVVSTGRFPGRASAGFGHGFVMALIALVGQFVVLGLAVVVHVLPSMAADGLNPPSWLNNVNFAKPALMVMGFWAAIGSNNMLLYLAALTNIPEDLYEAADIDGASRLDRFWNVTWPQLAPTTFFILVMSTIGGLQGGFEMARVMTNGGPAGATTTLSFYIYDLGFITGRLGLASAVSWVLFVLVFCVTLFNWNFGNRYVND